MPLSLYEGRRRKRNLGGIITKWVLALIVLAGAAGYAYDRGRENAEAEIARLQGEIAATGGETATLRRDVESLRRETEAAKSAVADWRGRYESAVSSDAVRGLIELVRQRLDAGVAAERLGEVIGAVENVRNCEPAQNKRFIVTIPRARGGNDSVSFGDNAVLVTAEGKPVLSAEGQAEAWFDPGQPVAVRFIAPGGRSWETAGVLPLHHALVLDDREYRFSLVAGERGFIRVIGERCRYP